MPESITLSGRRNHTHHSSGTSGSSNIAGPDSVLLATVEEIAKAWGTTRSRRRARCPMCTASCPLIPAGPDDLVRDAAAARSRRRRRDHYRPLRRSARPDGESVFYEIAGCGGGGTISPMGRHGCSIDIDHQGFLAECAAVGAPNRSASRPAGPVWIRPSDGMLAQLVADDEPDYALDRAMTGDVLGHRQLPAEKSAVDSGVDADARCLGLGTRTRTLPGPDMYGVAPVDSGRAR